MTKATMTFEVGQVKMVALGADHGGRDLKEALVRRLRVMGLGVLDLGVSGDGAADYPDYAGAVCRAVLSGEAEAGVLVCTTGIGMSIAANRNAGIQAALVHDVETAAITRSHNAANVLCLAGATTGVAEAEEILGIFLGTAFEGGRHERRVGKANGGISAGLEACDPAVAAAVAAEGRRQWENIELIASENFASRAVREAQGSVLTNKYAEGYPGRRWYGGCEFVDEVEELAIRRACELFGAKFANVQPHSGSQANAAIYFSLLELGDKILTMDLSHGGHLTHGHPANFSGKFYGVRHYGVSREERRIDYDSLAEVALEFRPKMITAGASAYPRVIDFARMRAIADSVGAYLFVDMAHIAGLVAGGVHPSPMGHAHVVSTTTHKSLRGPRGGLVLSDDEEIAKKIDSMVFPGVQGGPLMHVIAAKAVCFHEALRPEFADYQRQVVGNAAALASGMVDQGYELVSGGTDNHLMLVDVRPQGLNGKVVQEALDRAGITVNKNSIPFDTESPFKGGGIRMGTPAVTTRGMGLEEMATIAGFIGRAIEGRKSPDELELIRGEVRDLNAGFPLP